MTLREWTNGVGADFNAWASKLPTTQFKTLVGAALAVLSFVLFAALTLLEKPIEEVAWGLWLAFVAAWAALDFKQFQHKRNTEWKKDEAPPAPRASTAMPEVRG